MIVDFVEWRDYESSELAEPSVNEVQRRLHPRLPRILELGSKGAWEVLCWRQRATGQLGDEDSGGVNVGKVF